MHRSSFCLFFFIDPATTDIYTLSLHDALPISGSDEGKDRLGDHRRGADEGALDEQRRQRVRQDVPPQRPEEPGACGLRDRKSTRLNSSHMSISYAVFCLKKKKKQNKRKTHKTI